MLRVSRSGWNGPRIVWQGRWNLRIPVMGWTEHGISHLRLDGLGLRQSKNKTCWLSGRTSFKIVLSELDDPSATHLQGKSTYLYQ